MLISVIVLNIFNAFNRAIGGEVHELKASNCERAAEGGSASRCFPTWQRFVFSNEQILCGIQVGEHLERKCVAEAGRYRTYPKRCSHSAVHSDVVHIKLWEAESLLHYVAAPHTTGNLP